MINCQKLAAVVTGTVLSLGVFEAISLPSYGAVLEPGSSFAGQTLGEISGDWWKAVLETPFDQNPLVNPDADGSLTNAFNDPSNPVFYLTGVVIPDLVPVNRQVTVTEGKGIFFPLINTVNVLDPTNPQTVEELRAEAAAVIDGVDSLFATIDGVEIPNLFDRREQSPTFNLNLPEGNLFGVPSGVYGPGISDGYWVMVTDLDPGEYTISFGGSVGDFTQDNTYTVNVVPVPEPSTLGFISVGIIGLLTRKRQQQ